jgi:oligopeptide/dipeptide ABC transporter ATP-binding protein
MYAGRIVERSPVGEIYSQPVHPYTEALLKAIPRPDRVSRAPLSAIPGSPPDLSRPQDGCSFQPRCPVAGDICRTVAPTPAIEVREGPHPISAECHFASERFARAKRLAPHGPAAQ